MGNAADVQGRAAFALAKLDQRLGGERVSELIPIVEGAMTDPDPLVRQYALAAASELPQLSASLLIGILAATREGNTNVATVAFQTLAKRPGLELNSEQWRVFVYSAKMALQSSDIKLRFEAAGAAAKLRRRWEIDEPVPAMKDIEALITHDISHFVRAQWT